MWYLMVAAVDILCLAIEVKEYLELKKKISIVFAVLWLILAVYNVIMFINGGVVE